MKHTYITQTPLNFDLDELNSQLSELLEETDIQECLTEFRQISFCGKDIFDGLYNVGPTVKKLERIWHLEKNYANFNERFVNTIFKQVWDQVKNYSHLPICRMTLRKMLPGTSLIFHKDGNIRWHLALRSNTGCFMTFYNKQSREYLTQHIPVDGHVYLTDTKKWHTAVNSSLEDRYAIIISTFDQE